MNKENLQKAAKLISTIPQEKFNMRDYRSSNNDRLTPECNSVGCVIGHCTVLDKNIDIFRYVRNGTIKFELWSEVFFGFPAYSYKWDYLFSSDWSKYKETNTPEHAVYRINKILNDYQPRDIEFEVGWAVKDILLKSGS